MRIYFHDAVLGNLKLILTAPSTKKERGRGEKKNFVCHYLIQNSPPLKVMFRQRLSFWISLVQSLAASSC